MGKLFKDFLDEAEMTPEEFKRLITYVIGGAIGLISFAWWFKLLEVLFFQ